jgi:hypothetical protein
VRGASSRMRPGARTLTQGAAVPGEGCGNDPHLRRDQATRGWASARGLLRRLCLVESSRLGSDQNGNGYEGNRK